MHNQLKHVCDHCTNYIYDDYEEVPIYLLEFPNDLFFFCSEDCLWEFVKEHTLDGWVNPKGSIERD